MKELERDLGPPSVLAISIGAVIGGGIFILPVLALRITGPTEMFLAYALAGGFVICIALSKSQRSAV
jgi:amino acid permease